MFSLGFYDKIRIFICPFQTIFDLIPDNRKILDIGCGKGTFYRNFLFKKKYASYTGIDIDKNSIKNLNKLQNKNTNFEIMSIEEIVPNISQYDCILIIDVMHHVKKSNQQSTIENIIKNLDNNSILIYKDISTKNFLKAAINKIHDLIFSFQLINYYHINNITKFIKKNNKILILKQFVESKLCYDHEFLVLKK